MAADGVCSLHHSCPGCLQRPRHLPVQAKCEKLPKILPSLFPPVTDEEETARFQVRAKHLATSAAHRAMERRVSASTHTEYVRPRHPLKLVCTLEGRRWK